MEFLASILLWVLVLAAIIWIVGHAIEDTAKLTSSVIWNWQQERRQAERDAQHLAEIKQGNARLRNRLGSQAAAYRRCEVTSPNRAQRVLNPASRHVADCRGRTRK